MLRAMSIRSVRSYGLVLGCLLTSTSLGGCAYGEVRQVVRAQFAAELDCADVKVDERNTFEQNYKPGQYVMRGCGQVRTYTCPADAGLIEYDSHECTFVQGDMSIGRPAPTTTSAADDSMDDGSGAGGESMDEGMDNNAGAGDEAAPADEKPADEKPKAKSEKKSSFKASGNFKVGN